VIATCFFIAINLDILYILFVNCEELASERIFTGSETRIADVTINRHFKNLRQQVLQSSCRENKFSTIRSLSSGFLLQVAAFLKMSSDSPRANFQCSLQVKKLSENAIVPTRGSPLSAGFDLSSAEHTVIKAGGKGIVKTDLSIACPLGTYARIAPRSGLAVKKFIDVGAGVVDADYRGPVGVVLFNFGEEDFVVEKGDRIAQLILEKVSMAETLEVGDLSDTARGEGGFGSTGIRN
jgi:deoxyuridine 5''-triphosphate nucleotidohydrolase (dut)